jgi:hypothetical protein
MENNKFNMKRLPPFTGKRKIDWVKTVGLITAVTIAGIIAGCELTHSNLRILPSSMSSGDTTRYNIAVAPGIEHGTITPDKFQAYSGESILLGVVTEPGYRLKSLVYSTDGDGVEHIISGQYFIMPASNVTVRGDFELIGASGDITGDTTLYDITVDPGIVHGTITPSKFQAYSGESILLAIETEQGYRIKSLVYSTDSAEHIISGQYFIMPASDVTVRGEFELIPNDAAKYGVTVDPPPVNGTIIPGKSGPQAAAQGEIISLAITPDGGCRLKSGTLKYNDGTDHAISGNSFIMPAHDVTITGEFELIPLATAVELDVHEFQRLNMYAGHPRNTITLTARVLPDAEGSPKALQEVEWHTVETGEGASPRVTIAEKYPGNSLIVVVTGKNSGDVSVYATAKDGSGKSDQCLIYVSR